MSDVSARSARLFVLVRSGPARRHRPPGAAYHRSGDRRGALCACRRLVGHRPGVRRRRTRGDVMPGLRGRLSTLMKAKTSAALDRAEDPTQTLDYSYEKQLELIANVKKGITEVATSRKRLQNQQDSLREQVVKLDGQARQALAAGNEDLSREALERKQDVQDEIGSLDAPGAGLQRPHGEPT